MIPTILNNITGFSEELLLHYCAPSDTLVSEVLQFDVNKLTENTDEQLSKYIIILGQYLVTLRYNINLKSVEYMLLNKSFEHDVAILTFKEKFPKEVSTAKTKRAYIIENVQSVNDKYVSMLQAEAYKMIIENMDKSVDCFLNSLKKELSRRLNARQDF